MRLAILAIGVTIGLLIFGFVGIMEGLRFRSPHTVTYEQFLKEKPQEGWFRIKDAHLNVIESAYAENQTSHTINKAFVPVTSIEAMLADKGEKTYLLMETTDSGILDTVRGTRGITDEKSAIKFVADNPQRAYQTRDIEGMIQTGLHSDSDTRKELSKLDDSLAPDYVILEQDKHPSLAEGFGMFLGGAVLAVAQVLYYGQKFLRRR